MATYVPYTWPQPAQPAPAGTWPQVSPPRTLLQQVYNNAQQLWHADFEAGPNNAEGFAVGTFYSLQSSTMFSN